MPSYGSIGFNPTVGYDPLKGGFKPYPAQSGGINDAYFLTKLPSSPTDSSHKYPATDSASAATAWGPGGNFESPVAHDFPGTPFVTRATIENPLLKEATLAALKVLGQDPDGFFIMIEQGDIDWANHANDFQRMVGTVWDLHTAVQTAIDFINQPDDGIDWFNTLAIVTSDHSNSYMRLHSDLMAGDLPTQEGTCVYGGPACSYAEFEFNTSGRLL